MPFEKKVAPKKKKNGWTGLPLHPKKKKSGEQGRGDF